MFKLGMMLDKNEFNKKYNR